MGGNFFIRTGVATPQLQIGYRVLLSYFPNIFFKNGKEWIGFPCKEQKMWFDVRPSTKYSDKKVCLKFSENPFTNFKHIPPFTPPDPRRGNRFDKRCDDTVTCEMGQCFWFFAWRNLWRPLTSPLLQWWYNKCQTCFLFSRERMKTTFCNTANMYITLLSKKYQYIYDNWQSKI